VSLARRAAGGGAYVAASVGPYGATLADGSEYRGDYALGEEELLRWHEERLRWIAGAAPDVLAMETIPSFAEARALARALREGAGVPAWISFACRDGERIADGTPLRDCAAHLDGCEEVVAIGVNCVAPSLVPSLLREGRRGTRKPLVAYPNSGELWDARTRCWTGPRDSTDFARSAASWLPLGAKILGGCCRTTPSHTLSLSHHLPASRPPHPT
jgi:homocysteine S-methyltransferase